MEEVWNSKSLQDLPGEEWRDIVGLESLYMVSNYGRIKRLYRSFFRVNGRLQYHEEKILNLPPDKDGYSRICLSYKGKRFEKKVHRIVAEAFVGNPTGMVINHKNGVKNCNIVSNLEITTVKENNLHSFRMGRKTRNKIQVNQYLIKNRKNKFQEAIIDSLLETHESITEAARKLSIGDSAIVACCKGRIKSAGGFIWRYANV